MSALDGRPEWDIPCTDATGRPGILTVAVTSVGEVVLIAPAGCSATVIPDRVEWLVGSLNAAKSLARGERND
ncbi:MAG TPA: hypothetical protein DGG94_17300 [Micromonosporaceae bacterium]|nr:hypothetical protein [Micromonosporaceae bacterium]